MSETQLRLELAAWGEPLVRLGTPVRALTYADTEGLLVTLDAPLVHEECVYRHAVIRPRRPAAAARHRRPGRAGHDEGEAGGGERRQHGADAQDPGQHQAERGDRRASCRVFGDVSSTMNP